MLTITNKGAPLKVHTDLGDLALETGTNTVDDALWSTAKRYLDVKNALEGGRLIVETTPAAAPPPPAASSSGAAAAPSPAVTPPPASSGK
jgi:hypothetical protein